MQSPLQNQVTHAQLRSFNAVVSEGNMSSAARKLGLSQPAVTAQIRALESNFGVLLFERTGSGVRMTPLAHRLYAETRGLGEIEDLAFNILTASQSLQSGDLHIMCGAPNPAMQLIAEYRRLYPGVRVTATFGNWHDVKSALFDFRCDAAIVTEAPDHPDLLVSAYRSQRIVALLHPSHPLAQKADGLSLHDLKDQPLIFRIEHSLTQKTIDDALQANRITVSPVLKLGAREALYEAVTEGLGIGFMFELAVIRNDGLVRLPITELPTAFMENVACLSKNMRRREVAALMSLAREKSIEH
jgi:LysR family transcriptional regulator, low CO2-responsive transcriptional regulator